ncbi:hypothetical protein [Weissella viridescens]|uniref:hypothetical protein n=1 Tax=Weissella viridescens TaxID=1629 RepID=UPI003AF22461
MWKDSAWVSNAMLVLQAVSYLVSILGIVGIFITVKQFKNAAEKDSEKTIERKVTNSLTIMGIFAKELIPEISDFEKQYKVRFENKLDDELNKLKEKLRREGKMPEPQIESLTVAIFDEKVKRNYSGLVKSELGVVNIFNRLEQLSIYMNYDLVIEDMVYPGMHKVFIGFVEDNFEIFDLIRSDESPFKELTNLHERWSKRQKIEAIDNEQKKLENRLRELRKTND